LALRIQHPPTSLGGHLEQLAVLDLAQVVAEAAVQTMLQGLDTPARREAMAVGVVAAAAFTSLPMALPLLAPQGTSLELLEMVEMLAQSRERVAVVAGHYP
jgi:hypothetical protein